jgi:CPA2 family monovalent cation:H+ antiporter-2
VSVLAASASGPPEYLTQVVALVGAAAVIGYLCARLRIVPIVGFLLAGVLIGPSVAGIVDEREVVDAAAEVGVILLLFTIGIEFSLARLRAIRRTVLLGGVLQVGLTVGAVTAVCALAGVDLRSALFTGLVVSLSSTALVLKLLADRGATNSRAGQTAVALLIFQDLAVVAMVLLVPVLGGSGGGGPGELARALVVAAAVVALTLVVARRVMPPVLEAVARACSPEVFLLSVIALCLGTAYLTALAGVSVSLGAFLAGLVVSESRHSAHALGEVLPLQIIFSAVFFLSIGTLLDVGFLVEEPLLVFAAVVGVVVVKLLTTGIAAYAVGLPLRTAAAVALLLAQVGEFAFVLERAGAAQGLSVGGLGERGAQAFLAGTVLLLVATPGLAAVGRSLDARAPRPERAGAPASGESPDAPVLVSGWGAAARDLVADLSAGDVRVVVVTLNPDGAAEAERAGVHVVRGDSTKAHVLHEAGISGARVVVVGDDEPEQAERIASVVSGVAPSAHVVVLAQDSDDVPRLHATGASSVVLSRRVAHARLAETVRARLAAAPPLRRTVADTSAVVAFTPDPGEACPHVAAFRPVVPDATGCSDCMRDGHDDWVHLRLCGSCGHVGCCDSSPRRHATTHAAADEHPVMCSLEPGEDWGWCYLDQRTVSPAR